MFTFSPIGENTYIIYNGNNEAAVVDPGCYFPEEREQLRAFVEEKSLVPKILLNTHCHLDHVFGNRFVHETWGLELHLHRNEVPMLDYAPVSGQMWNLPFDNYDGPRHFMEDGGEVLLGSNRLELILAPGHSPGSICFYSQEQHFILGGDVLFRNSIGRTDLPGGDYDTLISSIKNRLFSLPDETVVYSGHGEPTTIGYEKKNNPFVGQLANR
jgi:glyoxylase-like metal-dependent hydrolase (beta-lactamase superfamily II)